MGVKSTVEISREEAEARLASYIVQMRTNELERLLREHVAQLSNEEIEDQLMELNDERAGGEGFENYQIT